MAIEVPAFMKIFLRIRPLAFINLALGLVSFVFQVSLSAKYGFPRDAAGIWCGIFFIIAGLFALYAIPNSRIKTITSVAMVLAILAFIFGLVQMGLASAAIDSAVPESMVIPSFANGNLPSTIVDNYNYHVGVKRGLLAVILICSLMAIPVNALLSVALYNEYTAEI